MVDIAQARRKEWDMRPEDGAIHRDDRLVVGKRKGESREREKEGEEKRFFTESPQLVVERAKTTSRGDSRCLNRIVLFLQYIICTYS